MGLAFPSQALLSMGFPRQQYESGLAFPFPGDLPDPGIESVSPAIASGFFTTEPPGKPKIHTHTDTQMSGNETGNLRCVTCIQIVHYSFAGCFHHKKLGDMYMVQLCIECLTYESAILSKWKV